MEEYFDSKKPKNEEVNRGKNDDTFNGSSVKEANDISSLEKNRKKIKTASKVISLSAAATGAFLVALGISNIFMNQPSAKFSYEVVKETTNINLNYSVELTNVEKVTEYYLVVLTSGTELSKTGFTTAKISSTILMNTYPDNTAFDFKVFDIKDNIFNEETYIYKIPA